MAFQKKYWYQFAELETNEIHVVEIWHDTPDVIIAEEVKGGDIPFIVEMPAIDHKFQTVRGNGCKIELFSNSDRKFFDGLYHVDPQEMKVLHYIDGVLNWCGYLNSEFVSEPYDQEYNYIISTLGNNGFSLMDRFFFLQSDGNIYEGVKSEFELLQIVLDKINLPYQYLFIYLSTTIPGITPSVDESLLHYSYVNCSNFYDEDNQPMTLREVLDSILAPYGAFIIEVNSNIYIIDIHSLASLSIITYQQYDLSDYSYIGEYVQPNVLDVVFVGYLGTGQTIEKSGGKNMQVVSYSPYPSKLVSQQTLTIPGEFDTVPETWNTKNGYEYRTLDDHYFWFTQSNPIDNTFEESRYLTKSEESFVYVRWPVQSTLYPILLIKANKRPYLNITGAKALPYQSGGRPGSGSGRVRYVDGVGLLITGKVLVKTKDNPYNDTQTSIDFDQLGLNYYLTCGDYAWNKSLNSWEYNPIPTPINTVWTNGQGVISDKFVNIGSGGNGLFVPIGNADNEIVLDGNLSFVILSDIYSLRPNDWIADMETNSSDIQEIWLKDIEIKLTNIDGTEIEDTDIEYIGYLDERFKDSAEKISLKTGTDVKFADRGKIMAGDSGSFASVYEWLRNGQQFKIEELLLCSLSANYRSGYLKLLNMNLKRVFWLNNVITDTTFLPTEKFMITSASIDYRNHTINCELTEIFEDELTIVKV